MGYPSFPPPAGSRDSPPARYRSAAIVCSKAGYSTQVYRLADGTVTTIDFTKLVLVSLFDQATALQPDVIVETPTAIFTRFADRGRDRHARENEFHLYDHYLGYY